MTGEREGRNHPPLLRVSGLRVGVTRQGRFSRIVDGLDLDLDEGETLGIVGESGSGKSLAMKAIMGILPRGVHADGTVSVRGQNILGETERRLRRRRGSQIAMILQDPFTSLNPQMRCGDQIAEGLARPSARFGMARAQQRDEVARRLAEVGVDDLAVADAFPFELSGGLRQRVAIAAALAGDPELVIADEPSTALDVRTQKAVMDRLKKLQSSRGTALILITHDLRVAFSMCDRIAVMYAGSLVEVSSRSSLLESPAHPYTRGLLLSEPPVERRLARIPTMPGSVPRADEVSTQCAFAPRCDWVRSECESSRPLLRVVRPGQSSACRRVHEIRDDIRATGRDEQRSAPPSPTISRGDAPLLAVDSAAVQFAGSGREKVALAGVTLEIGRQECVGLVGESGSGKTTLGRSIVGLQKLSHGRIELDGLDVSDYDRLSSEDRRRARRTVQMIFQDPYTTLNPMRTIGATLGEALSVGKARVTKLDARVVGLLEQVGLPRSYASRLPAALSGGERQRVAIARALAVEPRLIVCDEAVSALDVSVQAQILNLLAEVKEQRGVAFLFITHDLAVVRQVSDRIYVLREGHVVEEGSSEVILTQPSENYTRELLNSIPRMPGAEPRASQDMSTRK